MPAFGKGVEYALHCLSALIGARDGVVYTVADLARFQGISETYLAKVFTKLTKAGLVRSSTGAKGGYELSRPPERITFWDVVVAVEGNVKLFECREIRRGCVLYKDQEEKPDWLVGGKCEIHAAMIEVEERMKAALQEKTLAWLSETVAQKIPGEEMARFARWFQQPDLRQPE